MRLEDHPFFGQFTGASRSRLLASSVPQSYGAGTRVFAEGEAADAIYLVLDGEVELIKAGPRGQRAVIATLVPGDFLGDMGVIDQCPRSAGAVALGETTLARLPAEPFLEVLLSEPAPVCLRFFREIAERLRRANQHLVEQVVHAEKLTLVGQMADAIVHDFRNAMTVVGGIGVLLERAHPGDEKTRHYCAVIAEAMEHMHSMAQDLLEFSQGDTSLRREKVRVSDLLETIGRMNEDNLAQREIAFSSSGPDVVLEGDRTRLLRLLQNLVTNAAQAMSPGGGRLSVVAAAPEEGALEIRVIDSGPGIPERIRDRAFEPFVTAGKKQGAGLGLAIARRIVEAHGGTVSFETAAGSGTTFLVRLPRAS